MVAVELFAEPRSLLAIQMYEAVSSTRVESIVKTLVTITPIGVFVIDTILPLSVVLTSWNSVSGKPPPDRIQVMLGEGTPSAIQFKETELESTTMTEATGFVKIEGMTAEKEDIKELLNQ